MLANEAMFPNPNPALPTLLALLTAYDLSQQATLTKAKGTIAARNAKAQLVISALESEAAYVQGLCDGSPEQAVELIAGAAMFVAASSEHEKALLEATVVHETPGLVRLVANAKMLLGGSSKRPTFNWQASPDGGKTINTLQSTPHANTEVPNLPLLADAYFRVSVTLGKVTGPWSQWVKAFLH
ncbi:MAG: hypothetical protein WCI05_12725 [Myxococcales bacterium]